MHPTLISAVSSGAALKTEVDAAAKSLADAMEKVHGGRYRIQIDHDCQFAFIVRCRDRHPIHPSKETSR